MKLNEIVKMFPGVDDPHNTDVNDPLYQHRKAGGGVKPNKIDDLRKRNLRVISMILEPIFPETVSNMHRPTESRGQVEFGFRSKEAIQDLESKAKQHMNKIKSLIPGIMSWKITYLHDWTEEELNQRANHIREIKVLRIFVDSHMFGTSGEGAFVSAIKDTRNDNN